MKYKIYPFKIGTFYLDHSSICYMTRFGEKVLSPIESFLIKGENTNILVDTGCCGLEWSTKYHYPVTLDRENLVEKLAKHNLAPKDIKIVINTHLHWDHCFNNALFENADILIQKSELEFAQNPLPCQMIPYEARIPGVKPPWYAARKHFKIIDGDFELCEGINILHLPGHTPGSQSIEINTDIGPIIIAGDVIQSQNCIDDSFEGLPKPCGAHINLFDYYISLKKLMDRKPKIILPGHDMRVFEHECYPY